LPRILVVADETLREALGLHFADGSAEVTGAPAARAARLQALLERPSVVVCREASLDVPVVEFWSDLRKSGLDDARLLCVGEGETSSEDAAFCAEEDLLETVSAWALAEEPRTRDPMKKVQMLASLGRLSGENAAETPSFVNLLALGENALVFESPAPLGVGESLSLSFFVRGEGTHQRISLGCRLRTLTNASQLHYADEIVDMDAESRRLLTAFLANRNRSGAY
jgi:hypothetical protein